MAPIEAMYDVIERLDDNVVLLLAHRAGLPT